MLFRIFASKQNLWYGLWRTVRLYTYQYESFCFVFFFEGGGGGGWGLGRGCQGANFRDNYINNSKHISAEINYQLLFLISLSFSKIYYTLSYISINSQTFANTERIVYTWILSNSCSDNKSLHLCIDMSVCYAFLCRSYNCIKTAPKKRRRRGWSRLLHKAVIKNA